MPRKSPDDTPPDPAVAAADDLSGADLATAVRVQHTVRAALRADATYGFDRPWQDFLALLRFSHPQTYGRRCEARLCLDDEPGAWRTLGLEAPPAGPGETWQRVPSSDDRGDARVLTDADDPEDPDAGTWVEVKVSFVQQEGGMVNFVQVRPWQVLDGYRLFVVDLDNRLHRFDLTAKQMHAELQATGASIAHGTRQAATTHDRAEYAVRFAWDEDDEVLSRWRTRYQVAPVS